MITFLTDFADQAVVLPLILAVALVLARHRRWHGLAVWLGAVAVTFGLMLIMKAGFHACSPVFRAWRLHSPSGHTAAAAFTAGGLAALVTARRSAVWASAIAAACLIGFTRLAIGVHTVPEVVLGGLIGIAGAGALRHLIGPVPLAPRVPVLGAALVVVLLLHGVRLPAEAAIWHASAGMLDFIPACHAAARAR